MDKIKVAAVSYLNTKPLLYGIHHSPALLEMIELTETFPSEIARQLMSDEIDIGLVPVAVLPEMKAYYIISDYCIGATGKVASVCLFSDCPMDEIKKIYLDYQSRTSVALAKILLKSYWKISPELVEATPGYINDISGTTAGIVIGDRALEQRKKSTYIYDLAEGWIEMTGLPFVFAAWVANKKLPEDFIKLFNEANKKGIENLPAVIAQNSFPQYDLYSYYMQNISYNLDEEKKKGLELFLEMLEK
ncbi:MAG: menaquinone biosynthesis protein [Chitinophagaceae bacterium]